ncbi:endonuclease III [Candidatus Micrarchaeota archaeon]|nr:endonuclease III [Candidatus Micrarchaeota archaeon]
MNAKQKARAIIQRLRSRYPEAMTGLDYGTPIQLLISTILSAQCTDARVNHVTPKLFKKFKNASDFARANRIELEQRIRSTGYYHAKARHIQRASRMIIERFNGKVPKTMEELVQLPGVGRKTANIVLGNAFGILDGIPVDTHVQRVSKRLGLTHHKDPAKIERDLMKLVRKSERLLISDLLIFHGRAICNARKPHCSQCTIRTWCSSAGTVPGNW